MCNCLNCQITYAESVINQYDHGADVSYAIEKIDLLTLDGYYKSHGRYTARVNNINQRLATMKAKLRLIQAGGG